MSDHYKVLQVPRDAPTADIRRQYQKLALQLHPDKALQSGTPPVADGSMTFERVTAAWEVLKRADRRAEYDASLAGRDVHTQGPIHAEVDLDEMEYDEDPRVISLPPARPHAQTTNVSISPADAVVFSA
ncbi:DnaJ domain-containing protein [Blyttiomyces helicus]|uniref:DnaJ domain-containing protein n=1 Tax=Blyttiomyces helicus TaxID=388810 RepID=A0A4P9W0J9_9FUNG|nr:DnaJ domain-containing protein [Blyttiomyces helicus]|eukprot:RKO84070.1 DnaJ domain-containing protein [Blyttiomyces helicus]